MRTKRGNSFNKQSYFDYEINGKEFDIQGELYYNKSKQRYEHIHVGLRGGETLIYWTEKERV